jgi:hypothetical protein
MEPPKAVHGTPQNMNVRPVGNAALPVAAPQAAMGHIHALNPAVEP